MRRPLPLAWNSLWIYRWDHPAVLSPSEGSLVPRSSVTFTKVRLTLTWWSWTGGIVHLLARKKSQQHPRINLHILAYIAVRSSSKSFRWRSPCQLASWLYHRHSCSSREEHVLHHNHLHHDRFVPQLLFDAPESWCCCNSIMNCSRSTLYVNNNVFF